MRNLTASELTVGDQFGYGHHAYTVRSIERVGNIVNVTYDAASFPMGFFADSPVTLLEDEAPVIVTPKPFKVYTRQYKANGDCDKQIFSYATRAEQARFISRTNKCVTFYN